jgi:hypothetical protein
MEAWYRAAAVRMHATSPAAAATAVQALGMLQPGKDVPGGVSGRWLQQLLGHSQAILQQQIQQAQQQQRQQPQQPQQTQQQNQHEEQQRQQELQEQQQLGAAAVGFSASDLSKLLWGLAELKVWPGKPWLDDWLAGMLPVGCQLSDTVPYICVCTWLHLLVTHMHAF